MGDSMPGQMTCYSVGFDDISPGMEPFVGSNNLSQCGGGKRRTKRRSSRRHSKRRSSRRHSKRRSSRRHSKKSLRMNKSRKMRRIRRHFRKNRK